jgi:fatty-acyl-CoA synthase
MGLTFHSFDLTVASALSSRATASPEDPYLLFRDQVFTYGEVDARAESLAATLAGFGLKPGDRLALLLPAWPEFVITMFAGSKLGLVVVPLNPRVTQPELQFFLRHSGAACVVTVETLHDVDYLHLFEDLLPQLPSLRNVVTVGEEDLWYDDRIFQFEDALLAGAGRDFDATEIDPAVDPFALIYTAGTTAKPKAVELTHTNMLAVAARTVEAIGLTGADRVLGVTGLFHAFGMGPGLLGTLLAGASLVLQEEFAGPEMPRLIERHGVSVLYSVPPLLRAALHEQRERPRDLSSLRTGIVSGAPVTEELLRDVRAEMCSGMEVAYSLTETSSSVSVTISTDGPDKRRFTVGRPLPGVDVRILDPEGEVLPSESVGEIAVKGIGVMKGYYRQPTLTAGFFAEDGFFRSGDLGLIDEDGYIHLVGRRREVIIRSGLSVYPLEVEDRIQGHPGVEDVAVVGLPDEVMGESVCACIVTVEGAITTPQEIRDWCAVTLAGYKIPDDVRFLDELPVTGTGKVRRRELARLVAAGTTPGA